MRLPASCDALARSPLAYSLALSLALHLALLAGIEIAPIPGGVGAETISVQILEAADAAAGKETGVDAQTRPDAPDVAAASAAENPGLAAPLWYRVRQVDVRPQALGPIDPAYPEGASSQGLEGAVKLRLKIDEAGRVQEAKVVEAAPPGVFDAAALAAFAAARFTPASKDGRPVRYEGFYQVAFELD